MSEKDQAANCAQNKQLRVECALGAEVLLKRVVYFADAVNRYAKHDQGCLWLKPLPTGHGTWGCTCGLDAIQLDAEEPLTLASLKCDSP